MIGIISAILIPWDIMELEESMLPQGVSIPTYATKKNAEWMCLKVDTFLKKQNVVNDAEAFLIITEGLFSFWRTEDFPWSDDYGRLWDPKTYDKPIKYMWSEYLEGVCFLKFKNNESWKSLNLRYYTVDWSGENESERKFGLKNYSYIDFLKKFKEKSISVKKERAIRNAENKLVN